MSAETSSDPDERSVEERAEAMMERFTSEASRLIGRFTGRAREELEDMVAEAQSIRQRDERSGDSRAGV